MTEEAEPEEETVEIKGVDVPKSVVEAIQDGAHTNANKRFKAKLKELIGDNTPEDFDWKRAGTKDLVELISQQKAEIDRMRQEKPKQKEDPEKLRDKLRAELEHENEKKIAQLQHQMNVQSALNEVQAEAIKLGLDDSFKDPDLFKAMFTKHFAIEFDDNKRIFKGLSKDNWLYDENGDPRGASWVANELKKVYKSAFAQQHVGLGVQAPNGSPRGTNKAFDPIKMDSMELIQMGMAQRAQND